MQRAWMWCAVDVAISLVLLGGLYYWTHAQRAASGRSTRRANAA
jgi:uncharacterized iron-regulated membrane protein